MGKAFLYANGSGSGKLFAAIGVTYSAGSTCTCTNYNGTKILKAKNTSGRWVFAIPEADTWTVKVGNKSKSVEIVTEGQFEVINLATLVVLDSINGLAPDYSLVAMAGGSANVSNKQIKLESTTSGFNKAYIKPAIDCEHYSKLTFTACQTGAGSTSSYFKVGLVKTLPTNSADSNPTFAAVKSLSVSTDPSTYTIDLSGINEPCYLMFSAFYMAPGYISSIVFE